MILRLFRRLLALWSPLTPKQLWRDSDVWAVAARSSVIVDQELLVGQRLALSYAQAVLREVRAAPRRMEPPVGVYPRAHVTPMEVYVRPATSYRKAAAHVGREFPELRLAPARDWLSIDVSEANPELVARRAARDRLMDLVDADVKAAQRETERDAYVASSRVTGTRRIIHPELAVSGESCGLCVAASTRIYSKHVLMPIHGGCNCTSMSVTAEHDPGAHMNDIDLKAIYKAAGSTAREDLSRLRVAVGEHGELGPILIREGEATRGRTDIDAPAFVPPPANDVAAARARKRASHERQAELSQLWVTHLEQAASKGEHEFTYRGRTYKATPGEQALRMQREALNYHRHQLRRTAA